MDIRTRILYDVIENYVTALFEQSDAPALVFHNLLHTQNVVKRTLEIGRHYKLAEKESFVLFAAAWVHDTGHLFTEPHIHEAMSCDIMSKFLSNKVNDADIVNGIEECIMATKLPRSPQNLLQEIICDADTYHLGTNEFVKMNNLMRQELELKYGDVDVVQFNRDTVKMLEQHRFYTDYCKDYLNEKKENNLIELRTKSVLNH